MRPTTVPTRLLVRRVWALPRWWAAWFVALTAYALIALADSLIVKEASRVPTGAYLALAGVVPTVWHVDWAGAPLPMRQEWVARCLGGIGFVALAFPVWVFATPRLSWHEGWSDAARLILWAAGSALAWSVLASTWRSGAVSYLAAGLALLPLARLLRDDPPIWEPLLNLSVTRTYFLQSPTHWLYLTGLWVIGIGGAVRQQGAMRNFFSNQG
ncbi:MAG: hypothetical protein O3A46_08660 [Candidatus Poribacteria bacterium]|nr:hypothetical protein [Candidatus Poribacteria bacterium]